MLAPGQSHAAWAHLLLVCDPRGQHGSRGCLDVSLSLVQNPGGRHWPVVGMAGDRRWGWGQELSWLGTVQRRILLLVTC